MERESEQRRQRTMPARAHVCNRRASQAAKGRIGSEKATKEIAQAESHQLAVRTDGVAVSEDDISFTDGQENNDKQV
jgi:hypothetical protein